MKDYPVIKRKAKESAQGDLCSSHKRFKKSRVNINKIKILLNAGETFLQLYLVINRYNALYVCTPPSKPGIFKFIGRFPNYFAIFVISLFRGKSRYISSLFWRTFWRTPQFSEILAYDLAYGQK